MLAKTSAGGLCLAFPDVCLTPPAPVPVPYPNVAADPVHVGFVPNVMLTGAPAHNLGTVAPMTNGDNAGVALGVASGTVMGPARCVTAAWSVLIGGMPMTRLGCATIQNSTNAAGVKLVPSATSVMVFSG